MNDHAIIQHVLLRVKFVLSRKQYTSSLASAISRVQFVISRKIADTKTLGIDSKWDIWLYTSSVAEAMFIRNVC